MHVVITSVTFSIYFNEFKKSLWQVSLTKACKVQELSAWGSVGGITSGCNSELLLLLT